MKHFHRGRLQYIYISSCGIKLLLRLNTCTLTAPALSLCVVVCVCLCWVCVCFCVIEQERKTENDRQKWEAAPSEEEGKKRILKKRKGFYKCFPPPFPPPLFLFRRSLWQKFFFLRPQRRNITLSLASTNTKQSKANNFLKTLQVTNIILTSNTNS